MFPSEQAYRISIVIVVARRGDAGRRTLAFI